MGMGNATASGQPTKAESKRRTVTPVRRSRSGAISMATTSGRHRGPGDIVVAAVAQTLRGQVVDVNLVGISLDPADTAAAIASQRSPALDRREGSLGRRPHCEGRFLHGSVHKAGSSSTAWDSDRSPWDTATHPQQRPLSARPARRELLPTNGLGAWCRPKRFLEQVPVRI
jgi:hypothetical protein